MCVIIFHLVPIKALKFSNSNSVTLTILTEGKVTTAMSYQKCAAHSRRVMTFKIQSFLQFAFHFFQKIRNTFLNKIFTLPLLSTLISHLFYLYSLFHFAHPLHKSQAFKNTSIHFSMQFPLSSFFFCYILFFISFLSPLSLYPNFICVFPVFLDSSFPIFHFHLPPSILCVCVVVCVCICTCMNVCMCESIYRFAS